MYMKSISNLSRVIKWYPTITAQNTTCTGSPITAHLSINQRKSNFRHVSILQRSAAMFTSTTAIWWISQAFTIKHTIKLKPSCTLMFLILILVDSLQWMKYHLYLSPCPPAFVSAYSLPSLIYKQFSRRSKNAWQGRRCSIRCCSLQTVECLVTCIEMRRQHQYLKKNLKTHFFTCYNFISSRMLSVSHFGTTVISTSSCS